MDPFLPAWRLAELTASGQIGCLELLDFYLDRAHRLNPRLNAIILQDADRARARARTLDQDGRGDAGPFFGVPMTVKESYDLAGHPTTWGFKFREDHRADGDALAVQRLEAAGAVVFGKTNVPVALADWQSFNPVYGSTNNPWNLGHTPGGSSGGGAAACAAGLGGLELGSDIGGSIRVPAHFCGIFGHKPSWGLCSPRGHTLSDAAAMTDISVIGPLARSARDLEAALSVIAGPDPVETTLHHELPRARATRPSDLRVAVWSHQPGQATDSETKAAIEAAGRHLASQGAQVDFAARPAFDPVEAYHLYLTLLDAALSARLPDSALTRRREAKAALRPDDMSADAVMIRATDLPHRMWLQVNDRRHHVRRAWGAFFQDFDVLLCPALAVPALPHMQQGESWERTLTVDGASFAYNDLLFWPGITCGYHLPASVAPVGLSGRAAADRRADRRSALRRSDDDCRGAHAGRRFSRFHAAAGVGLGKVGWTVPVPPALPFPRLYLNRLLRDLGRQSMKHGLRACLAAAVFSFSAANAESMAVSPAITAAVASPDRPKADTDRDALRHPAELIAFAGLKPGDQVADLMPGKGYFTRIFSNVVGPTGHVYAIVPTELAQMAPKIPEAMKALVAEKAFSNVSSVVMPTASIAAPLKLDLAWTSDNYHDLYGFFGADQAAKFDTAVFNALKPGGIFIVMDHVAKAGTSDTSPKALHRIDPETVKAQVLAAGFKLEAESGLLRNPADSHELKVFAPEIRGHTDQFVFKFRKPA